MQIEEIKSVRRDFILSHPSLFSVSQAAEQLGLSPDTLYRMIRAGKCPMRLSECPSSGAVRIRSTDLVDYLFPLPGERESTKLQKRRRGRPTKAEQLARSGVQN